MAFLMFSETLNFNAYRVRALPILENHFQLKAEMEKLQIEKDGHPDDIYIKHG